MFAIGREMFVIVSRNFALNSFFLLNVKENILNRIDPCDAIVSYSRDKSARETIKTLRHL